MHLKPSIDFPLANALLTSALSRSLELGARVSIAIADHAGELIAFARMDGARSFTIDLAVEKARAAAKLAIPTSVLEASGRRSSNGNPWSAGGLPILHQGECAGGLGISGARPEIDNDIAETVLAALKQS